MTYDTIGAPGAPSRHNHFHQNRASLKRGKFSGFHSFTQEDGAVVLSAGPIKDRTRETLAPADAAVMRYYRLLMAMAQSAAAGAKPIGVDADPRRIAGRNATLAHGVDWRTLVPGHEITNRWRGGREAASTAAQTAAE
jgi:hypothetical protein